MKLPRQPRNTLTDSTKYINTSVTERKRRNVSCNQWLGSSDPSQKKGHVEEAVRVHLIDR